ncbi:YIP1 family protein [Acidipila rosea]|uniref:Yip1-like protein n=1 Tax=Acidipila rosea TaxID=768535 RepID=A0A4V6NEV3_9BACT|nr:YIP1 family protein [Acidipila rosea]TCK75091.1 Yip1-like protein [Acidipila rosea]
MSDLSPALNAEPLSQVERVVDTFTAPSKTFHDILRNASWWLPFLISVLVALIFCGTIQKKVGWERVYENILNQSPKAQQRFEGMAPQQAAQAKAIASKFTAVSSYMYPVFGLIAAALAAAVLMATLNFGLGGHAKFSQLFAVWMYAYLPAALKALLAVLALFAGVGADSFLIQNPLGSNIGYYLGSDVPLWLRSLGTSIDLFTIWTLALLILGCSIVARVKRGSAAAAVIGWWLIITIVGVGYAAIAA